MSYGAAFFLRKDTHVAAASPSGLRTRRPSRRDRVYSRQKPPDDRHGGSCRYRIRRLLVWRLRLSRTHVSYVQSADFAALGHLTPPGATASAEPATAQPPPAARLEAIPPGTPAAAGSTSST